MRYIELNCSYGPSHLRLLEKHDQFDDADPGLPRLVHECTVEEQRAAGMRREVVRRLAGNLKLRHTASERYYRRPLGTVLGVVVPRCTRLF